MSKRAEKRAHYRITIDVVAKSDGVNRCSDIRHHLYMSKNQLVPYTVEAEDVKYKVELLSIEAEGQAEKDLALTWRDIQRIITVNELYSCEMIHPPYKSKEYCEEVLRRFREERR